MVRPGIDFTELDLPKGTYVYRLETYRTLNPWWSRLWRPKYNQRLLAITHPVSEGAGNGAIYDITEIANKMIEKAKNAGADYDFMPYSVGLVSASVCTSLPLKEATKRLNESHPTGIDSKWHFSKDETFKGGHPNPCPCDRYPETHKHYLFNC